MLHDWRRVCLTILVDRIYEAALVTELWPGGLDRLSEMTGARPWLWDSAIRRDGLLPKWLPRTASFCHRRCMDAQQASGTLTICGTPRFFARRGGDA